MHILHLVVTVAAWLIAVAWVAKLVEAARGLATVPNLLDPQYDIAPAESPLLAVIVPARNEAANVAACLESLVKQDYQNLRIIAVNDRSTDNTGSIMADLASANRACLEVLTVTELPPNWLGKTHAMALAARTAIAVHHADYVLFTDADILFRPDAIRRALAEAVATRSDHFVVLPTTLIKTPGEGMLLAYLQMMSMWAIRLWRVSDPKALRDAIGVGAFNLIRTPVYQQLGGFDSTPMEILDDLALGLRVKRAGFRQRVATAPGMVCVHWAEGLQGIVAGMGKNLFAVFRFRPLWLLAGALWMVLFCIAPVAFLALRSTRVAGLIAVAAVAALSALWSRTSQISRLYALTFPIAAAVVVYSMLRSMVITLAAGGVNWRGTFYPLGELRRNASLKR
jgi:glycosyltransferase involved in cell wall biosynthesis